MPAPLALGVDFGTSNSAVALLGGDGVARLLPLEGDATNLPSAVFFNAEERRVHFGREAMALYLAGVDGRLMRALKSLLGSKLLHEHTAVPEGSIAFQAIVARFLKELRLRAEARLGQPCTRVLLGRPVHFVDDSQERDAQAETDLRQAARTAGFEEIGFELEPIAAALDYERRVARETRVLIADIGGGTSDFTVVRLGPDRMARADRTHDVLATSGIHIGGTDYDRRLNLAEVMPLLGFGHLGPGGREVPNPVFFKLATWHLINFLYAPAALREAHALRSSYADRALHDRLMQVLQERLGHHLVAEVEQAKIRASTSQQDTAIDLACIAPQLAATLSRDGLRQHLAALLDQVVDCAGECVQRAGIAAPDAIYLTGGSAALPAFQDALRAAFSGVPLVEGDLFGGVASGLAYASARRLQAG